MAAARTPLVLAASLGAAAGLALGAAVGLRLAPDAPIVAPAPERGAPAVAPDAARLRELEAQVARWRSAYEELARSQQPEAAEYEDDAVDTGATAGAGGPDAPEAVAQEAFDTQSLQDLGYTEDEVRRLRERFEAYQLELLYLNDRARREGWRRTPQFGVESRRLAEALQAELGDRDYDAVLFGAGLANRVKVAGVLSGSVAEFAGLRDGDEVISYDGRRVFDPQSLRRATSQGDAGVQTELRVRRGDEELRILLPRGPIGIRLQPIRSQPEGFR